MSSANAATGVAALLAATTTVTALLDENPDPSDEYAKHFLDGNICRCTGYVRYYEAIKDVALSTPGCVVD